MPGELPEVAKQRAGGKGGMTSLFHAGRPGPALPQHHRLFRQM